MSASRTKLAPGVNGRTNVFGIIGDPVAHSLSPLLHNAAFRFKKIDAIYVPFPVQAASPALKKGILGLGLRGLSVTIPHKAWAARVADAADDLSQYCGAANTLIREEEELHAYNTDGPGALRALEYRLKNLRGLRYLIVGYGGSATAIAHALLLERYPSLLAVTGRNRKKASKFVSDLNATHERQDVARRVALDELDGADYDVIINTTPLGMEGKEATLPIPDIIQADHAVFDIVYTPMRTPLLKLAERRRARAIPGYLMLLYQAVLQFELFTGEAAPEALMEKELLRALRNR